MSWCNPKVGIISLRHAQEVWAAQSRADYGLDVHAHKDAVTAWLAEGGIPEPELPASTRGSGAHWLCDTGRLLSLCVSLQNKDDHSKPPSYNNEYLMCQHL